MARKTIKSLENELNAALNLNKSYIEDIANLRQEIEDIKSEKGVISLVEYEQLKKQLSNEKSKNKLANIHYESLEKKYNDLINKNKEKNSRGAGRKMFNDRDIIEQIYALYIQGGSLKDIAEILNDNNSEIKNWSKSTVRFILLNKKNVELGFVDEDTYNKAFKLMSERRRNIKSKD